MSREVMQQALDAMEKIAAYQPLTFAECSDAEAVMSIAENAIPALRERLAQPEQEIDWKDQYEKQKRRAEMWRDKYEGVAGPDECVYPAQPEQEPPTFAEWTSDHVRDNLHKLKPEQESGAGCVCRWNAEGDRVVTCERHEGWLEVIAEWADRARDAEKKLKALNTSPPAQRKPLPLRERTSIVRANKMRHDSDEIDPYGVIDDVEAAHGIKEST